MIGTQVAPAADTPLPWLLALALVLVGVTVLVVDSSFDLVRQLCARLYGMDRGVLIGTFRPADFSSPDELAATYLGGEQRP